MASLFRFKFNDDIYTETGRTYNALLKRYGKENVKFLGKTDSSLFNKRSMISYLLNN